MSLPLSLPAGFLTTQYEKPNLPISLLLRVMFQQETNKEVAKDRPVRMPMGKTQALLASIPRVLCLQFDDTGLSVSGNIDVDCRTLTMEGNVLHFTAEHMKPDLLHILKSGSGEANRGWLAGTL